MFKSANSTIPAVTLISPHLTTTSAGNFCNIGVSYWHIEKYTEGFWKPKRRRRIFFTKTQCCDLSLQQYRRAKGQVESSGFSLIGYAGDPGLWWTSLGMFWAAVALSHDDVALLVWDRQRPQDSRLNRLRKIRIRENDLVETSQERIPQEVQAFVRRRDDEGCVRCGPQDGLQFDHIIPVARGQGYVG